MRQLADYTAEEIDNMSLEQLVKLRERLDVAASRTPLDEDQERVLGLVEMAINVVIENPSEEE